MKAKSVFRVGEVPHLWAAHNRGGYAPAHARSSAYSYRGAVLYSDPRESTPIARFYTTPMGDKVVLLCRDGRYSAAGALCEGDGRLISVARRVYLRSPQAWNAESLTEMLTGNVRERGMCDVADAAWFASRHGFDASRLLADAFASVARPTFAQGRVPESARELLDAAERNPYRLAMRGFAHAVAAWQWFERGDGPSRWDSVANSKATWLRVRCYPKSGPVVQSTRHAEFPVADAVRALPLIRRAMREGGWQERIASDAPVVRLGSFRINRVDAKGNVTAGCHHVEWPAIEACERLLLAMYAPPFNTVAEG